MIPVFLNLSEVLQIHRDQVERYGGDLGIRDIGLLQSALAMAAAYLFHISQNHPFLDGNKRTGAAAALVFLNDLSPKTARRKFVPFRVHPHFST